MNYQAKGMLSQLSQIFKVGVIVNSIALFIYKAKYNVSRETN